MKQINFNGVKGWTKSRVEKRLSNNTLKCFSFSFSFFLVNFIENPRLDFNHCVRKARDYEKLIDLVNIQWTDGYILVDARMKEDKKTHEPKIKRHYQIVAWKVD